MGYNRKHRKEVELNAQVNFRIPDDIYERAKAVAQKNGIPVSQIVRNALQEYANEGSSVEERLKRLEEAVARLEEKVK